MSSTAAWERPHPDLEPHSHCKLVSAPRRPPRSSGHPWRVSCHSCFRLPLCRVPDTGSLTLFFLARLLFTEKAGRGELPSPLLLLTTPRLGKVKGLEEDRAAVGLQHSGPPGVCVCLRALGPAGSTGSALLSGAADSLCRAPRLAA